MDTGLARTFLEVAATGSFGAAADRLFVTQSAVSLRIARLEDALGRPLFTRSRAGAQLTPAGVAFERHALSLLKVWEEARLEVGLPAGFTRSLNVGAQYSLWPSLGFALLDGLRAGVPGLNLRAELGMADRLTRFLSEGSVQLGLLYTPQLRPGLRAERLMEDALVMVAAGGVEGIAQRYVFVDWGPEFAAAHALHLPHLSQGGLSLGLGALAAEFVIARGLAAYMPARAAAAPLAEGRLALVPDAPVFPYPVWAVWREDLDADLAAEVGAVLDEVVARASAGGAATRARLDALSVAPVEVLGDPAPPLPPEA